MALDCCWFDENICYFNSSESARKEYINNLLTGVNDDTDCAGILYWLTLGDIIFWLGDKFP